MMIPRTNYVDFFDDVFDNSMFGKRESKMMRTDIKEKEGEYVFEIDIPGANKEDIKIDLENGYLTVSAKMNNVKEESKDGNYIYKERYTEDASRSFYVGENVEEDKIHASFNNGVLNITVPKVSEEKIESKRQINIE